MPQYVNQERGGHTDKSETGAARALATIFRYKLETLRRCREAEGRKTEADGRRFKMYSRQARPCEDAGPAACAPQGSAPALCSSASLAHSERQVRK